MNAQKFVAHHEATEEVWHYEVMQSTITEACPEGLRLAVTDEPAHDAWDEYEAVQKYVLYTEEELATIEVTVPGVLDKESDAAVSELTRAGFKYKLVGGAGRVENQNPSSGSQIPKDGTVILYTNGASPSNNCVVPDLNGLTLANAKRELEDMGLNIRVTGNTNAGSVVCMQEPVAGSKAAGGSIVTVKLKSYSNVAD